jgi:hypothetical protein
VATPATRFVHADIWSHLLLVLEESAFGGSLESGGRFCFRAFDRILVSVAVNMFNI